MESDLDGVIFFALTRAASFVETLVGDLHGADLLRAADGAAVAGGEGVEDGGLAGGAEANDGEVHREKDYTGSVIRVTEVVLTGGVEWLEYSN